MAPGTARVRVPPAGLGKVRFCKVALTSIAKMYLYFPRTARVQLCQDKFVTWKIVFDVTNSYIHSSILKRLKKRTFVVKVGNLCFLGLSLSEIM